MTYKKMLDELKAGYVWGKTYSPENGQTWVKYPYYKPMLYFIENNGAGRPCIGWSHYGSSANRFNKDELQFIIRIIFETTLKDFCKTHEKQFMPHF